MKYEIDFLVAGLIVLAVLFVYLKSQYKNSVSRSVYYLKRLIIFLFVADMFDIITAYTISYSESVPVWVNYVLNTIFFELEVLCISFFPKYILALFENAKQKDIFDKINDGIIIIYSIICASSPFTHFIFYFDDNKNYQKGTLYYLIFILPLYFMLHALIRVFIYRKEFSRQKFLSVVWFVSLGISGPLIQALFLDNKIIDYFMLSIASFTAFVGLETPDYIKLQKALETLEEKERLLEKTKDIEIERNKAIHAMTKSASWSLSVNSEGEVTDNFWSDDFFWLLGYEPNEFEDDMTRTTLWNDSLHPEDHDRVLDSFMKGLAGQEKYNEVYRLRSKNGEYRWYLGTGELKKLPNDQGSAFLGIIHDINEEKIKEDLMHEKTDALEKLEQSQADLEKAVVRAESADRAKSDFLANMSHEIRTPINAVLGLNELIQRESTEENIQRYSSDVAEAGNTLLSLINDILDFSKIEAGKMELAPAEYELSSLIREVNNMIGIRCKDRGLKFIIRNNPDIPNYLYGDEVRIRQILINILNNAIKYTDEGLVTLIVDYEKLSDNNINLILTAKDTGIGIKEEDLASLFESFKRIDLASNRKKEGTGLGLSITKSFVDLMGGTINVESTYGKGSAFTISIPQTIIKDEKIGIFKSDSTNSRKYRYEASFLAPAANILIVDDVEMNIKVIQGLLKQTKIQVDTALSGKECLEKIADTEYDIILLDHMMPEMDGIETLQIMKSDESHPNQNTPVIMLTANAIMGAKEEYIETGFSDYLSKPVKSDLLEAMLLKYLPENKIQKNQ